MGQTHARSGGGAGEGGLVRTLEAISIKKGPTAGHDAEVVHDASPVVVELVDEWRDPLTHRLGVGPEDGSDLLAEVPIDRLGQDELVRFLSHGGRRARGNP